MFLRQQVYMQRAVGIVAKLPERAQWSFHVTDDDNAVDSFATLTIIVPDEKTLNEVKSSFGSAFPSEPDFVGEDETDTYSFEHDGLEIDVSLEAAYD